MSVKSVQFCDIWGDVKFSDKETVPVHRPKIEFSVSFDSVAMDSTRTWHRMLLGIEGRKLLKFALVGGGEIVSSVDGFVSPQKCFLDACLSGDIEEVNHWKGYIGRQEVLDKGFCLARQYFKWEVIEGLFDVISNEMLIDFLCSWQWLDKERLCDRIYSCFDDACKSEDCDLIEILRPYVRLEDLISFYLRAIELGHEEVIVVLEKGFDARIYDMVLEKAYIDKQDMTIERFVSKASQPSIRKWFIMACLEDRIKVLLCLFPVVDRKVFVEQYVRALAKGWNLVAWFLEVRLSSEERQKSKKMLSRLGVAVPKDRLGHNPDLKPAICCFR